MLGVFTVDRREYALAMVSRMRRVVNKNGNDFERNYSDEFLFILYKCLSILHRSIDVLSKRFPITTGQSIIIISLGSIIAVFIMWILKISISIMSGHPTGLFIPDLLRR